MKSNKLILIILALISFLLTFNKLTKFTSILILITIAVGYCVTKDIILSVSVGFILGNIYISLNTVGKREKIENFKSASGKKGKKAKKTKRVKQVSVKENFGQDDKINEDFEDSDDENEEFKMDTKESFYDNYKALTPKQVKGLNKDTQNLIATQKQLIETLNNMGPALKDGKHVLDSFKNYFGNDADISKALKEYKSQ